MGKVNPFSREAHFFGTLPRRVLTQRLFLVKTAAGPVLNEAYNFG
jgi:hypothetical protein